MKLWQQFLISLEPEFGKNVIDQCLSSLEVQKFDACNLYLEARDAFQFSWFEEHIRPLVKKDFLNHSGHPIKIHLSYPGQKVKITSTPLPSPHAEIQPDSLDPTATFSSFLPQEKTLSAYKLLAELAGFDTEKKQNSIPTLDRGTFNPILKVSAPL